MDIGSREPAHSDLVWDYKDQTNELDGNGKEINRNTRSMHQVVSQPEFGAGKFGVAAGEEIYVVDLASLTCSHRIWQLLELVTMLFMYTTRKDEPRRFYSCLLQC